jgi:hypothetical protein
MDVVEVRLPVVRTTVMRAWEPEPEVFATAAPAPVTRLWCAGCGLGISCALAPDRCPTCGGTAFELQSWQLVGENGQLGWRAVSA